MLEHQQTYCTYISLLATIICSSHHPEVVLKLVSPTPGGADGPVELADGFLLYSGKEGHDVGCLEADEVQCPDSSTQAQVPKLQLDVPHDALPVQYVGSEV